MEKFRGNFLLLKKKEQVELISRCGEKLNISPILIEKDFWF